MGKLSWVKVPSAPCSRKRIAKHKGVHREVESEGSGMANLWSDEQKSHIRQFIMDKVAKQTEVQNYRKIYEL